MSKRYRKGPYTLKNWYIQSVFDDWHCAVGSVYGNPNFPDGKFIHTSPIESFEENSDTLMLVTRNSVYFCAQADRLKPASAEQLDEEPFCVMEAPYEEDEP